MISNYSNFRAKNTQKNNLTAYAKQGEKIYPSLYQFYSNLSLICASYIAMKTE